MATQSVRIGWRPYVNLTSVQAAANLLDSYSGAAAAYSLRKLSATWSGSAIRVRRSSDNTEQNIGFDDGGNLDTIALSSFVGSGSGFVTTWYDQTGNNFNRTQTTAAGQPNIVYLGAINMVNGKPAMYFDPNVGFALQGPKIGETYQGAGYSSTVLNVTKLDSSYSTTEEYPLFGGTGWYDSRFSINSNKWYLINTGTGISSTVNASANQVVSSVVFAYTTDKVRINGTEVISGNVGISGGTNYNYIGQSWLGKRYKGYFQEHIIYASDKTSVISAMESNMNTYYSAYPNPTSVWNLLNAVYSADTTASSSLKTSLVSVYNGESNTNDSKGTNNGTAQGGLTYGTGKIGNAFVFNGSNSYVALPTNSLSSLTGDLSISCWVNLTSLTSVQCFLSNYIYTAGINDGFIGFRLFYNTSGGVEFGLGDINSLSTVLKTNNYLTTNTWYNIVVTRKGSTRTKIYINGLQSVSNTDSRNPAYVTTYPAIGTAQYLSNNNTWFMSNGSKIDAVGIWNKELTASEVSELYNSGNGAQYITDNFYKPTPNDALNTYNGTAQGGLTYGVGKVGTAFQFNGTNAYVALPNNIMKFSNTDNWSISFWIYATVAGYSDVIGNNNWEGGQGTGWGIRTYTAGGDPSKFSIQLFTNWVNGMGNLLNLLATDGTTSINTWNHFVITRNSSAQEKIYQNGTLVASQTNSSTKLTYPATSYSNIGVNRYNSTGFEGYAKAGSKIDGLSVWSKELTSTEVTELYNLGNGKQYPN